MEQINETHVRRLALLNGLKTIPKAVEKLAGKIHDLFPVGDRHWGRGIVPKDGVSQIVFAAQKDLETLLNPKSERWSKFEVEVAGDQQKVWEGFLRFRAAALAPPPINWHDLLQALEYVTYAHLQIADHYGWRERLLNLKVDYDEGTATVPPLPWSWPEVPAIPETLLRDLEGYGVALGKVIDEYLATICGTEEHSAAPAAPISMYEANGQKEESQGELSNSTSAPSRLKNEGRPVLARLALALLLAGTGKPNMARISRDLGVKRTTLLSWPEVKESYDKKMDDYLAETSRRRRRLRKGDEEDDEEDDEE